MPPIRGMVSTVMPPGFRGRMCRMRHCTVRYHVRLVPKSVDDRSLDAVGIFYEEREPDVVGDPGALVSRRLVTFSGPSGYRVRDMVTRGTEWKMDVLSRIDPLRWDS